jgi:hypothetical protein
MSGRGEPYGHEDTAGWSESYLESGCYGDTGTVVELDVDWRVRHNVIPSGVDVQAEHEGLLRFDDGGTQCEGNGTFECGPWHIDDVPFAERKAPHEQAGIRKQKEVTVEESP